MSSLRNRRPVRRPEYWVFLGAIAFVAVCFYGVRAAAVMGLAGVTAILTDFICLFFRGRSYKLVDLSNVGAAVVLALMFPATVPYSIVVLSTVFAVAVGAHVFGYRKDLLFPPAAIGYLFALICWKDEILLFPQVGNYLSLFDNDVPMVASLSSEYNANPLSAMAHMDGLELLIGAVPGPMGTSCVLLLLLGIVILLLRRQINFWALLGSQFCIIIPVVFGVAEMKIYCTNMLLFSMVFFMNDPSVLPTRGMLSYFAVLLTALLTGFLIFRFQLEYAPVVAVILTCPFWHWIGAIEERHPKLTSSFFKQPAIQQKED